MASTATPAATFTVGAVDPSVCDELRSRDDAGNGGEAVDEGAPPEPVIARMFEDERVAFRVDRR